jgi:hypothetical protein
MASAAVFSRAPLALVAAFCTGVGATVLCSPVAGIGPAWLGESLAGAIGGAIWMASGLIVAHRVPAVAPLLFFPGAALAWYLSRGVVHSTSVY